MFWGSSTLMSRLVLLWYTGWINISSLHMLKSKSWLVPPNNCSAQSKCMYLSCDHVHLKLKQQGWKRGMEASGWCNNFIFWPVSSRVTDGGGSHFHYHKTNSSIHFKCASNLIDRECEFSHFFSEQDQYVCSWLVSLKLYINF